MIANVRLFMKQERNDQKKISYFVYILFVMCAKRHKMLVPKILKMNFDKILYPVLSKLF